MAAPDKNNLNTNTQQFNYYNDANITQNNINNNYNNINNSSYNSLLNEMYQVFIKTRASAHHLKNRNDLFQFVENCIRNEIDAWNKKRDDNIQINSDRSNLFLLFGSSVLGIDTNAINNQSDIDYALCIDVCRKTETNNTNNNEKKQNDHDENINNENINYSIKILKSLKEILSKTQITPDFHNQYKQNNHYNNELLTMVNCRKEMKFCNQNRKNLLRDRKEYKRNPNNNALKHYKGGQYSFKLTTVFNNVNQNNNNASYSMPLVKIMDPFYNVCMDLCGVSKQQKNKLGLTVKLMNYLLNYKFDNRIRPFIVNIKYWCKMREIFCSFKGFINSYCYVLMAIKYLQMINPPILPIIIDLNVLQNNQNAKAIANTTQVDQLLIGFFQFWSHFNCIKYGIDLCKNGLFVRDFKSSNSVLLIVDPIDSSNNCASAVKSNGMTVIMNEFQRAATLLSENKSWIQSVCVPDAQ